MVMMVMMMMMMMIDDEDDGDDEVDNVDDDDDDDTAVQCVRLRKGERVSGGRKVKVEKWKISSNFFMFLSNSGKCCCSVWAVSTSPDLQNLQESLESRPRFTLLTILNVWTFWNLLDPPSSFWTIWDWVEGNFQCVDNP